MSFAESVSKIQRMTVCQKIDDSGPRAEIVGKSGCIRYFILRGALISGPAGELTVQNEQTFTVDVVH